VLSVESAAILLEFAAAPHAPKHGPGNTHRNTVATPSTLNSADEYVPAVSLCARLRLSVCR
jgi:hypothetical protein